jgi:hypothetical protein
MDYAFPNKRQKAITDLTQHLDGFGLWTLQVRFYISGEVPVTELLDYVIILGALHDVVKANDVIGMQFLDDFYFIF